MHIEATARAIVRADTFDSNVEVLNRLYSQNRDAAGWCDLFGGDVCYGQGVMPDAVYADVLAVQRRVDQLRAEREARARERRLAEL